MTDDNLFHTVAHLRRLLELLKAHFARQTSVPSRAPGGLDDARRRGVANIDDPRARHQIGRPWLHIENELQPVLAQSDRILGQELLLPLDLFAIEKSPVVAAKIGETERDLIAANHADHGMTAADNIVARRVRTRSSTWDLGRWLFRLNRLAKYVRSDWPWSRKDDG